MSLNEDIENISRDTETGNYVFNADLVTDQIVDMPGYREPQEGEPALGEKNKQILDDYLTHLIKEYARMNSVSVEIIELHGPGGGHPYVSFTGSFSAIYDLYLSYNGIDNDAEDNRDIVRAGVDKKTEI